MTSLVFPDVNVWVALSTPSHRHFPLAWRWYGALPEDMALVFCRITQLSLLRLLTTRTVMADETLSQLQAWKTYDRWLAEGGAEFREEPSELEVCFRSLTKSSKGSAKDWADAYLAAFSMTSGISLVTFDKALAGKAEGAVLLG